MSSFLSLAKALDAPAIVEAFDALFVESHDTRLRGGAPEPLYTPDLNGSGATIQFRDDYASSALHEVAHWCIAGSRRRALVDYGYWYDADGRSASAQTAFMRAEALPQALEWFFSLAGGLRFRLSLDNLDAPPDPQAASAFADAVCTQARRLRNQGLPPRAALFFEGLAARRAVDLRAQRLEFSPGALL